VPNHATLQKEAADRVSKTLILRRKLAIRAVGHVTLSRGGDVMLCRKIACLDSIREVECQETENLFLLSF
jgi:hypothetical protein